MTLLHRKYVFTFAENEDYDLNFSKMWDTESEGKKVT